MSVNRYVKCSYFGLLRPSSLSKNSEGNHLGNSRYGTDESTSSKVRGIPRPNSFGGMTHVSQNQGPYTSYSMNKAGNMLLFFYQTFFLLIVFPYQWLMAGQWFSPGIPGCLQ